MNAGDVGEFGLISRIVARVGPSAGVVTGIGDDAAVTALSPGMQLVTSTDMLLEDVHFRRAWHDPFLLGRKSLAVSVSDLAAMGAVPRWALLSLAIPADLPLEFIDEFTRGFLSLAAEHSVVLIGGDTCASRSGLVLSVTIMGEQLPGRIVRRSGALPGDEIWVTGTLGDAALGLRLLEDGFDSAQPPKSAQLANSAEPLNNTADLACPLNGAEGLVSRLLDPSPRAAAGIALAVAGVASAMIDVSDGILADFGHIAKLSAVGGCLQLEQLPLSENFLAVAPLDMAIRQQLALSGGEDYELCFTAAPAHHKKIIDLMKKSGIQATPVGIVTSLPGVDVLRTDGSCYNPPVKGFNHFT